MAYTLTTSLALGASKAGLADLRAQLVNTSGSDVGSAVSTGFVEIGQGYYLWHYASYPDGHRGGVKFYSNADSGTMLAFVAINPEEAENTDTKTSGVDDAVWIVAARTTTGGVVDTNNDKTGYALSAAGVLAIWDRAVADLDEVGSIGKRIVDNLNAVVGDVASNVWGVSVRALTDKANFTLSAAGVLAIWDVATSSLDEVGSIGKLLVDNINSTLSGVAAAVWGYGSGRTITDKDNFTLSAAGIQAIWDRATSSLTTVGSIGKFLIDRLDAAISSRSTLTAQQVWEYASRELTAFTAVAADVWSYASRTLTESSVTVDDTGTSNITSYIAATTTILFEGVAVPVSWTKVYFTVKEDLEAADSTALIQVVETNPGAGTDGLKYLNGSAGTAAQADITVNQAGGTIQVVISDDATAQLSPKSGYTYDVKIVTSGGTSTIPLNGLFHVLPTPTKAVS